MMVGCFLHLRRVTSVCTGGAGGQAWAESSEGLQSGPAPRPPGFVTSGEELRESEPVFGGVDGKTNISRAATMNRWRVYGKHARALPKLDWTPWPPASAQVPTPHSQPVAPGSGWVPPSLLQRLASPPSSTRGLSTGRLVSGAIGHLLRRWRGSRLCQPAHPGPPGLSGC